MCTVIQSESNCQIASVFSNGVDSWWLRYLHYLYMALFAIQFLTSQNVNWFDIGTPVRKIITPK